MSISNNQLKNIENIDIRNISGELYAKGIWAANNSKYNEAKDLYNKILSHKNLIPFVYHNLGNINSSLKEFNQAIENYTKSIKYSSAEKYYIDTAFYNRGNIFAYLGKSKKAVRDYSKAIKYVKKQKSRPIPEFHFNRANTFITLGKFKKAIKDYNLAIDLKYYYSHFNKGNTLVRLGKFDEALLSYEKYQKKVSLEDKEINNFSLTKQISSLIKDLDQYSITVTEFCDLSANKYFIFQGDQGNAGNIGPGSEKGFKGKPSFSINFYFETNKD